jgi:hypothetical protein
VLSAQDIEKINRIWHRWLSGDRKRVKWFELYKTICPEYKLEFFIPDDFYYFYVDEFFAKRKECKIIDDKNLYDLLFYDVPQPRTIVRCVDGVLMGADYQAISHEHFISLIKKEKRVIVKKSVDSEGGKGIVFYDIAKDDDSLLYDCMKTKSFVVQEVINQHSELAKLHPESINTIRIMTFFFEGDVHILSAVVRMGIGGSKVDNASSGGIVCGVKDNGTLKNIAYDTKANRYYVHPSGTHFEDVRIPNYDECITLCKRLAPRFVQFSRLISWDLSINTEGHPILIEANLSYGQVDFHQMCNGPIFGDMSERIIEYINKNNSLLRYRI